MKGLLSKRLQPIVEKPVTVIFKCKNILIVDLRNMRDLGFKQKFCIGLNSEGSNV